VNLSRHDFIKGFGAFVAGLGLGAAKAEAKEVEAERLKLETLERCTPPDDLVRYPNGKIDVIGTIRAQIDRALR